MDNCIKCGKKCEIKNLRQLCSKCHHLRTPNVKLKKRAKLQEVSDNSKDSDYSPSSPSSGSATVSEEKRHRDTDADSLSSSTDNEDGKVNETRKKKQFHKTKAIKSSEQRYHDTDADSLSSTTDNEDGKVNETRKKKQFHKTKAIKSSEQRYHDTDQDSLSSSNDSEHGEEKKVTKQSSKTKANEHGNPRKKSIRKRKGNGHGSRKEPKTKRQATVSAEKRHCDTDADSLSSTTDSEDGKVNETRKKKQFHKTKAIKSSEQRYHDTDQDSISSSNDSEHEEEKKVTKQSSKKKANEHRNPRKMSIRKRKAKESAESRNKKDNQVKKPKVENQPCSSKVTEDIINYFGVANPLTPNKKQYNYKCPFQDCSYDQKDLKRHLMTVHSWVENRAKLEVSCRLKMFRYLSNSSKAGTYKPKVCKKCNICVERFSKHLKNSHQNELKKVKCIKKLTKRLAEKPKISIIGKQNNDDEESTLSSSSESDDSGDYGGYLSIIRHSKKLTERKLRNYKIEKEKFSFIYLTFRNLKADFLRWVSLIKTEDGAKQAASNLEKVWLCVDPKLSLLPNMLANLAILEDNFFLPAFLKIKANSKKGIPNKDLKPSTVMGRLSSLKLLLDFVSSRRLYIGLTWHDIEMLRIKLKEFHNRLKPFHKARERFMQTFKSTRILTPSDMNVYGQAPQIQDIVDVLNNINDNNSHHYSQKDAVAARNHLMVMITMGNAARASNLINLCQQEVNNAELEEEFDAYAISSINYKTSLLYGVKKLLLGKDLFQQLNNYIKHLRPKITCDPDNDNLHVFTSSREKGPMSHSAISNAMTTIFKSIPEFAMHERFQRISPTKLRHSIATQLAGVEREDLKTVAMQFMKNRPATTSRYYVCIWAQREASRLSMKCYGSFNISDTAIKKAKVPTPEETKAWFVKHKAAIQDDFGEVIKDDELVKAISNDDGLDELDEGYLSDTDEVLAPNVGEDSVKTCKTDKDEIKDLPQHWYRPRNIRPEVFFKIIYLSSSSITGVDKISETEWKTKKMVFDDDDEFQKLNWSTINELLKSMRKKFKKEKDHGSFNLLVESSVAYIKDLNYQDDETIIKATQDDSILSLAENNEIDFNMDDCAEEGSQNEVDQEDKVDTENEEAIEESAQVLKAEKQQNLSEPLNTNLSSSSSIQEPKQTFTILESVKVTGSKEEQKHTSPASPRTKKFDHPVKKSKRNLLASFHQEDDSLSSDDEDEVDEEAIEETAEVLKPEKQQNLSESLNRDLSSFSSIQEPKQVTNQEDKEDEEAVEETAQVLKSEKQQNLSESLNTHLSSSSSIQKTKKSGAEDDSKIENTSNKDWYISRLYNRRITLKLVHLGTDAITGKTNINQEFWDSKIEMEKDLPEGLDELGWPKIREMLKTMRKKYSKENNHDSYNTFLKEASIGLQALQINKKKKYTSVSPICHKNTANIVDQDLISEREEFVTNQEDKEDEEAVEETAQVLKSEKQQNLSESENTHLSSSSSIQETKKSGIEDDSKIEKTSNKDWYIARLYSRKITLKVVHLGTDAITGKTNINKEFWDSKIKMEKDLPEGLDELGWPKIREMLKTMRKKYSKENNHDSYNTFLKEASIGLQALQINKKKKSTSVSPICHKNTANIVDQDLISEREEFVTNQEDKEDEEAVEETAQVLKSEKQQNLSESENTHLSSSSSIQETKKSGIEDDSKIEKTSNKDWYIARLYSRKITLKVVHLGTDAITGKTNINKEFWDSKIKMEKDLPEGLDELGWPKIREMLKTMRKKYSKENNHDSYNTFLKEASIGLQALQINKKKKSTSVSPICHKNTANIADQNLISEREEFDDEGDCGNTSVETSYDKEHCKDLNNPILVAASDCSQPKFSPVNTETKAVPIPSNVHTSSNGLSCPPIATTSPCSYGKTIDDEGDCGNTSVETSYDKEHCKDLNNPNLVAASDCSQPKFSPVNTETKAVPIPSNVHISSNGLSCPPIATSSPCSYGKTIDDEGDCGNTSVETSYDKEHCKDLNNPILVAASDCSQPKFSPVNTETKAVPIPSNDHTSSNGLFCPPIATTSPCSYGKTIDDEGDCGNTSVKTSYDKEHCKDLNSPILVAASDCSQPKFSPVNTETKAVPIPPNVHTSSNGLSCPPIATTSPCSYGKTIDDEGDCGNTSVETSYDKEHCKDLNNPILVAASDCSQPKFSPVNTETKAVPIPSNVNTSSNGLSCPPIATTSPCSYGKTIDDEGDCGNTFVKTSYDKEHCKDLNSPILVAASDCSQPKFSPVNTETKAVPIPPNVHTSSNGLSCPPIATTSPCSYGKTIDDEGDCGNTSVETSYDKEHCKDLNNPILVAASDCSQPKFSPVNTETKAVPIPSNVHTSSNGLSCPPIATTSPCSYGKTIVSSTAWLGLEETMKFLSSGHDTYHTRSKSVSLEENKFALAQQVCRNKEDPEYLIKLWIDEYIGYGVYVLKDLVKGEFICEYPGELISDTERNLRIEQYDQEDLGSYIFDVQIENKKYILDATRSTRIGRYINDSPPRHINALPKVIHVDQKVYLCFFAAKDIPKNTEVRYSYSSKNLTWRSKARYARPINLKESPETTDDITKNSMAN
ncbi:titin homolog isoform X3 [Clytia hemisphaerica]|uniref:titin homolog isoform X3 n=1 Tax=Clytia hemisphaerica TaxID=252671 RepID=UPI0034D56137